MSRKIVSTVTIKCELGRVEEFKIAVSELMTETNKEQGCEVFRIFQNDENLEEFILWEIFKDQEALDIHMEKDYTKKCFSLGLFKLVSIVYQTEFNH